MISLDIDTKKLQSIVDIMATLMKVPAALIMKISDEFIEVFVSSNTPENPYKIRDKEHFINSGLYCEAAIKSNGMLKIPNALTDPDWQNNPDIKLGMISYLGLPIKLPSGEPFGTICVLDNKENHYCDEYVQLVTQLRDLIEEHFKVLEDKIEVAQAETWQASVRTMMYVVNNTLNSMVYFQEIMEASEDFKADDILLFKKLMSECSNELRKMGTVQKIDISCESFGNIVKY